MWVTGLLDDVVWRVDPDRGEIVATVAVGRGASGLFADEGTVWVANSIDGTVSRIDPATNSVVTTITVGGRPVDVALGDGDVWVASDTRDAHGGVDAEISIGLLADCRELTSFATDPEFAGAQLPLLERGGRRASGELADGIVEAKISGRTINLLTACTDGYNWSYLNELRWLVEDVGVAIVIGTHPPGMQSAVRDYAKRQPDVTFMATNGGLQSATLRDPAPNFFNFFPDASLWDAGLGAYAYHELGWREAAVVLSDLAVVYGSAARFIAEFCSLGRQITHRARATERGAQDHAEIVAEFPANGVDGVYMATHFEPLGALLTGHELFAGNIAERVIASWHTFVSDTTLYSDFADRLDGLVHGEPGHDPNPIGEAYERYATMMSEVFPEYGAVARFNPPLSYYNAMESALRALENVDGDLSRGQARFQQALADLEFEGPGGLLKLDQNRSLIGRAVASRLIIGEEGELLPVNFHRIDGVEQTYNGYFTPDSPEPSQAGPECVAGDPPHWALTSAR